MDACWGLLLHPGLQYFLENSLSHLYWKLYVEKNKAVISSFLMLSSVVYKYDQSNEHEISLQVLRE